MKLTKRAEDRLATVRDERHRHVGAHARVVRDDGSRVRWCTWAGLRMNARLVAALDDIAPTLLDETGAFDNLQIALRGDASMAAVGRAYAFLERAVCERWVLVRPVCPLPG